MNLAINGHNLNIEQYGHNRAPVVVLLHHGLGSVRAWKEQIPTLVEAGYQVLAYDRWGYGGSDDRPSLDLPTFANDLEDLQLMLKKLGISQVALVGHSDGGTIGLYFAAQHPVLVRCLLTIAAHIYVEPKMEGGILGVKRSFEHDLHFKLGLRHVHGDKYEQVFFNWFDGWYRLESLAWDMRPVLAHIRCPVLVVQGEDDEHATPQQAKDIAEAIPGAELWLVPGAGHMLPQECADLFNSRLIQFLEASHYSKQVLG